MGSFVYVALFTIHSKNFKDCQGISSILDLVRGFISGFNLY